MGAMEWNPTRLQTLAASSIKANLITTAQGPALRAGGHQFASLWTRDFCFAVPGLLAVGEKATAQNHLQMLLDAVTPEGWVPRLLDNERSALKVLRWTVGRKILPRHTPSRVLKTPLRREYLGEHRTLAYDGGALLYLASLQAGMPATPENIEAIKRIVKFYERLSDDFTRPIPQTAYSDWQDSARREGPRDFVNYLVLRVLRDAVSRGWIEKEALIEFEIVFNQEFMPGVLRPELSLHAVARGERQVSLETHLFRIQDAVSAGKMDVAEKLWKALKDHPVYHRAKVPGVPVDPEYADDQVSFFTKAVGLRHYHDRLCWTWLAAETAKTAKLVRDREEAERIFRVLDEVCAGYGDVPEVLDPESLEAFETLLYRSEMPFSWGAAKILEALAT